MGQTVIVLERSNKVPRCFMTLLYLTLTRRGMVAEAPEIRAGSAAL